MNNFLVIFLLQLVWHGAKSNEVYACDESDSPASVVYCKGGEGSLLQAMLIDSNLFSDSKDFVDSPLKYLPNTTISAFNSLADKKDPAALKKFYTEYFEPPAEELTKCTPSDWNAAPTAIMNIKDSDFSRFFALELNKLWKILCREMIPDVATNSTKYSLLPVPYQFIAPGGRFREYYYWDTYWIIKGLLTSGMHVTARHMILNLAHVFDKYGLIPNGGRLYYLHRSQPPMFTRMVYDYMASIGNSSILQSDVGSNGRKLIDILDGEFQYWMNNHSVTVHASGKQYFVFQYRTHQNTPRPESYDHDVNTTSNVLAGDRPRLFQNLASAAKSGVDFSSRWMNDHKSLHTTDILSIIPVDLNAHMCGNAALMAYFMEKSGNATGATYYQSKYTEFKQTMSQLFWNDDAGAWLDYNITKKGHNVRYNIIAAVPLFTNCYDSNDVMKYENILSYFQNENAFGYEYGVPTTLIDTDQQWDFPNAWPPLVHMLINGFASSKSVALRKEAVILAQKWVQANFDIHNSHQFMFEKVDVNNGKPLYSGEYVPQIGFGWSNGVVLDLLNSYSGQLVNTKANNSCNSDIA